MYLNSLNKLVSKVSTDLEFRCRLRLDSAFFFRTWSPSPSQICDNVDPDPVSLVMFSSSIISKSLRGLYTCHFLSKTNADFRLHRWQARSQKFR